MEKVFSSIVAALIPLLITFISKRNKDYIRKNVLEEAQNHINFISNYYDISRKIIEDKAVEDLRLQLSNELKDIKSKVNATLMQTHENHYEKMTAFQKVFLTFKPVSSTGWLWAMLFYLNFFLIVFGFLGFFANDKNEFTTGQFSKSIQDSNLIIGMFIFVLTLLLFRWLALRNYKNHIDKKSPAKIPVTVAADTA